MKFPSEYTEHFAISSSENGFILYYEDDQEDKKITKSRVYPQTIEGEKELLEDIIEIMGWFPAKRKDGLSVQIKRTEGF